MRMDVKITSSSMCFYRISLKGLHIHWWTLHIDLDSIYYFRKFYSIFAKVIIQCSRSDANGEYTMAIHVHILPVRDSMKNASMIITPARVAVGPSDESPRGRGDREEVPLPFEPDPGPWFQKGEIEMEHKGEAVRIRIWEFILSVKIYAFCIRFDDKYVAWEIWCEL